MKRLLFAVALFWAAIAPLLGHADDPTSRSEWVWEALPPLPDPLGVAGPFVGTHGDALIVAGGAHFPLPVWETAKVWHDRIHVLVRDGDSCSWRTTGALPHPVAYGASVSTPEGLLCMGGNDGTRTFDAVFLLQWDPATETVRTIHYPPLPRPCASGAATLIGNTIYFAGGQSGAGLETAMNNFWSLDLSKPTSADAFQWQERNAWPGPSRAFNLTVGQHNGYEDCVYVISGRCVDPQADGQVSFLQDVWEYAPSLDRWRRRRDVPRCVMAGSGIAVGHSHLLLLGGDDGSRFFQTDSLRDNHPGFPKQGLSYHTITDTWIPGGPIPDNQVTTNAVKWGDAIVIPSGEVRPRVRTPRVWRVTQSESRPDFGVLNYSVLFGYLLAMVGIGVAFTRRNRNTNDYFRGGQTIPWWAAGCSIFATMLSSLTFTGIPSKAYAQDWVYAVGNLMIPVVAVVAVFGAMPFFRSIDCTSAYEYLERRFDRSVRAFGSASFTLFQVFRMAVVMSLTGLALAVATPLTPAQSVMLMGALSIVYCTLGGIEAVIWTDTVQTVVLLGGALLAAAVLIAGVDGGWGGFLTSAQNADKFRLANWHGDLTSARIALWVVVVGGIAQNLSSYTADQAVVQRYLTTSSRRLAARAIWTNALMTIPATVIFFGIGTALFAFYRSHPARLDPSITTDQIFPFFIAREMPNGLAGLIVAGIFAAAQSTVSTSMNSTATTLVTDFLKPINACRSDRGYLNAARLLTFLIGVLGTALGLFFVNPQIKSLFDTFIMIIGLFMGVLGGLFLLGAMTRRANARGALLGACVGAGVMFGLWKYTSVNGYLYTASGLVTCVGVGYFSSLFLGHPRDDLQGLTLFTRRDRPKSPLDAAGFPR